LFLRNENQDMKIINYYIGFFFFLLLTNCSSVKEYSLSDSQPISHHTWDGLVKKNVTEEGFVDYKGFIQDSLPFRNYLNKLKNNHPNIKNWSKEERLAYWINAYNAFTVKLIIDNYPVKSIRDIKRSIPFLTKSVWDIDFIKIEGATYSLNQIEHGILRKQFTEPRIHFAINCASISCPRLRTESFEPDRLEEQLVDQTVYFLSNPIKNKITPNKIKLSKIFSWFSKDFQSSGGVKAFITQYTLVKIDKDAKYSDMPYDWSLNGE